MSEIEERHMLIKLEPVVRGSGGDRSPSGTPNLRRVQLIRKGVLLLALVMLVALALVSRSFDGMGGGRHEALEIIGRAAIVIAIVGRAWCSLYIGGRKKAEIVDRGPYSVSRNPLYVFSFLAAFGVGAQTGTLSVAVLFLLLAWLVFHFTVRREEVWLEASFGDAYRRYRERTPRFWPRFSLWRDEAELTIRPRFFLLTLRDGLVLLLAIPLFELIDVTQVSGAFRILFQLI